MSCRGISTHPNAMLSTSSPSEMELTRIDFCSSNPNESRAAPQFLHAQERRARAYGVMMMRERQPLTYQLFPIVFGVNNSENNSCKKAAFLA